MWAFPYGEYCDGAKGNQVVTLDGEGDPCRVSDTIQEGVDAIGYEGTGTIVVCPGRYAEHVLVWFRGPLDLTIVAPGGPVDTVLDASTTRASAALKFGSWYGRDGNLSEYSLVAKVVGLGVTGGLGGAVGSPLETGGGIVIEEPEDPAQSFPFRLDLDGVGVYGNSRGVVARSAGKSAFVSVKNSEIWANHGVGISGAVWSPIDLSGTVVHYNYGGGVSANGLVHGLVEQNVGPFGGVQLGGGELRSTVVRSNQSLGDGGGISGWGTLVDVWVEGNKARFGGGVFGGPFSFVGNTVVIGNHAELDGGGVYLAQAPLTGTVGQVITQNGAGRGGGGLFLYDEAAVTGVTVFGNEAQEGGGIASSGTVVLRDVSVFSNRAVTGGGIWSREVLDLEVVDLFDNVAETGGGIALAPGLWPPDPTVVLRGRSVAIYGNHAELGGGAWFDAGDFHRTVELEDSWVVGNDAPTGGGMALVGRGVHLLSTRVDWGAGDSDNRTGDLDVNGAAFDGDVWEVFSCDWSTCSEPPPPLDWL